jgi:CubicO group peptidase (beta-lactamase class C family)
VHIERRRWHRGLVIVDADDGVVHEEYWGEFGPDRISLVASSSKMITAGVLLRLQDDGLLDIDAPVADVVGWAGDPAITTAQLLSNSSGLVGLGPNLAYPPYLCQFNSRW